MRAQRRSRLGSSAATSATRRRARLEEIEVSLHTRSSRSPLSVAVSSTRAVLPWASAVIAAQSGAFAPKERSGGLHGDLMDAAQRR